MYYSTNSKIIIEHNIKVQNMSKIVHQVQQLIFVDVSLLDKQIHDEYKYIEGNNTSVLFIDCISNLSSDNINDNS